MKEGVIANNKNYKLKTMQESTNNGSEIRDVKNIILNKNSREEFFKKHKELAKILKEEYNPKIYDSIKPNEDLTKKIVSDGEPYLNSDSLKVLIDFYNAISSKKQSKYTKSKDKFLQEKIKKYKNKIKDSRLDYVFKHQNTSNVDPQMHLELYKKILKNKDFLLKMAIHLQSL